MDLPVTMMNPPIEDLLDRVDSKFTLVSLTASRARQINTYFSQLGQGLGMIAPPQVPTNSTKPVSIALEEIYRGRIVAVARQPETADDGVSPEADGAATKSA